MSAEEIEKRWSSLRDMFSRENRRQKLPPSGSGYEPTKEWEFYRNNMLLLIPHIAHRRTKTSFVLTQQNQSQGSLLETSTTNTFSPSKQSSNLIISPLSDHGYGGSFQPMKENRSLLNSENEENMPIDNEILKRPASTLSSCSSGSMQFSEPNTSFNLINLKSQPTFKHIKKIMPEMDGFAKRRKNKDDQIDRDLAEASKEISAAIKVVSSQIDQKREKDGYMFAIEEGLKYVPSRNRTQCIIEILQIIQKYEERQ